MMSGYKSYKMTDGFLQRRITMGLPIICYTCKKLLKSGRWITTQKSGATRTNIRHRTCSIRVGIVVQ